jgi:hypothetical protein
MPIDFESTTLTYPWAGFGVLFWGHPVSVVVNPDKTGNNLSNKVLKKKTIRSTSLCGTSLNLDSKLIFLKEQVKSKCLVS